MMRAFEIILANRTMRIVRQVIASNSVSATRIGIAMMPELRGPCRITCKPKEMPCAH